MTTPADSKARRARPARPIAAAAIALLLSGWTCDEHDRANRRTSSDPQQQSKPESAEKPEHAPNDRTRDADRGNAAPSLAGSRTPEAFASRLLEVVSGQDPAAFRELLHPKVRAYLQNRDPRLRAGLAEWIRRSPTSKLTKHALEVYPVETVPVTPFSNQYFPEKGILRTRFPAAGRPGSDARLYPPVGYFPVPPSHVVVLRDDGDTGEPRLLQVPPRNYVGLVADDGRWFATLLSTEIPEHVEPLRVDAPK